MRMSSNITYILCALEENMPAYKYTLKDGKTTKWYANFYYSNWIGEKKHVCKRGFKTQREAKEYERNFLDQQIKSCDILFSSLTENYLEDMSHRLKPTTIENKKSLIYGKLVPYFKNFKICDIDTLMIRRWQNEIINALGKEGKPYSQTYLKTINNQMSAIMNYAVRNYNLPRNPCIAAGSIGKGNAEEMNIRTKDQYEHFCTFVNKKAMKLAFDILFFTGIRSGELLALTPEDVLPDKALRICKNYAKIRGVEMFLTPKTPRSKRTLSIPDFLYNEILEYINSLYECKATDRIFYFTKHALTKEITRKDIAADLPPIRVHDLRHSHVSLLIELGFDITEISKRLGHDSVKTIWDTYSHVYPDRDKKLANELNKLR